MSIGLACMLVMASVPIAHLLLHTMHIHVLVHPHKHIHVHTSGHAHSRLHARVQIAHAISYVRA